MDYFPLFANLKNQSCLVVGGGEIAGRKTEMLLRCGANVTVVSKTIGESLSDLMARYAHLQIVEREFRPSDVKDHALIIAATNNDAVNRQVFEIAQRERCWVNVVDNPELCNFIVPAIVDRSPVQIAISSGGRSPVLVRLLREKIESLIPARIGDLAALAQRYRKPVKQRFKRVNERRKFWESVLSGPIASKIFNGESRQAEQLLEQLIEQADQTSPPTGEVYLVGAGPGDPDLLTFKALRLMQQADIVLYDRLVSPPILELARRDAQRIYVGKERNHHLVPQGEINQYLVDLAKKGHRVCRLKGGDPFIFGRGGEEIDRLAEAGISFQVVPGITAASGCASYAGIPLTHRDYSQSVRFITGHLKNGSVDLDWRNLARDSQTLVFYMGLVGLQTISAQLIEHGMAATMPVALIQQGTTDQQRVFIGTLDNISDLVSRHKVRAPTLIIVGEVVGMHEKLAWYRTRSITAHAGEGE